MLEASLQCEEQAGTRAQGGDAGSGECGESEIRRIWVREPERISD